MLLVAYKNKADQAAYARQHYQNNKEIYKRRAAVHRKAVRQKIRIYIFETLKMHPCVDCGESDPVVLDFDHRDRTAKRFNIADAVSCGASLKSVVAEILKCDVRCANCHRRKTYVENNGKYKSLAP